MQRRRRLRPGSLGAGTDRSSGDMSQKEVTGCRTRVDAANRGSGKAGREKTAAPRSVQRSGSSGGAQAALRIGASG